MLICICEACNERFALTPDQEGEGEGGIKQTYICIRSCSSGGIYDTSVRCPHCGHDHDLLP